MGDFPPNPLLKDILPVPLVFTDVRPVSLIPAIHTLPALPVSKLPIPGGVGKEEPRNLRRGWYSPSFAYKEQSNGPMRLRDGKCAKCTRAGNYASRVEYQRFGSKLEPVTYMSLEYSRISKKHVVPEQYVCSHCLNDIQAVSWNNTYGLFPRITNYYQMGFVSNG